MNESMVKLAADILGMTSDEARKNSKSIPEIDAAYFWESTRGGKAIIVNENCEKLAATSSVSFEDHVQAFINGKRN